MEHYLGQILKQLRESRGWTQKDLAIKLNKGFSTISGYETDAHTIPLDALISISAIFNVSLDELVGLEKSDSVSLKGLNEFQIHTIKELRNEFLVPTNQSHDLSEQQMRILHDVIKSFSR